MKPEIQKIERGGEGFSSPAVEQEPAHEVLEVKREPSRETPPTPHALPPTPSTVVPSAPKPSGHGGVSHDKLLTGIERILEEDLAEAYQGLPPDVARAFKEKGEETAVRIRDVVSRATVKVRAIVAALGDWLKMLPGINRFFLIQETKLKTDRILELKDWLQKKGPS